MPPRGRPCRDAESKIAFDKFHVAIHLGQAVDQVRRDENRVLCERGDETLKGSRHLWLYHPDRVPKHRLAKFQELVGKALKTSRAWALKEPAMEMWEAVDRDTARQIVDAWYSWAIRSRLESIKRVARMLKHHLEGVLNVIIARVTDARLEGLATVIQGLKRSARGFRSRSRFGNAIYFYLGGVEVYPDALTHSNS